MEKINHSCQCILVSNMISHGDDEDYSPFSRLCLELVTTQKCADQTDLETKNTNVKRFKLLNLTCSLSNIVLLAKHCLHALHMHLRNNNN